MFGSQRNTGPTYSSTDSSTLKPSHHAQTTSPALTPDAAGVLYYFNIRSDRTLKQDPEGSMLPDLKAALQEALALAHRSLRAGDRKGQDRRGWRVEIMDRTNEHLMSVAFTEADLCEWPRRSKGSRVLPG
jgi:hypothetical protein